MKLQAFYPDLAGEDDTRADSAELSSSGIREWPSSRVTRKTSSPGRDHRAAAACCENPGVARAIEKIRNEYSKPMTVASLARECGMSVRSLHRLYRSVTGNTIGKDLVARRLEAAAEMLREDDVKLEPVAMETGLRSAKNLCRLFKEHIGITPGQWKETFHGQEAGIS